MQQLLFSLFRAFKRHVAGLGLGRFPGVARLHDMLYSATRPRGIVLTECQGSKMYVNAGETSQHAAILLSGVIDPGQTQVFRGLVKPGMVVLDIGANVGYYTCLAARALAGTGRVYAFEPDPDNFDLLTRNIQINQYANVIAVQKGVSDTSGTFPLYLDKSSCLNHSLVGRNLEGNPDFIEVQTTSLDEFFATALDQRVDLIKMDAECAEGRIIAGAKKLFSNPGITMFMEFNARLLANTDTDPRSLLETLTTCGFALHAIELKTGVTQPVTPAAATELSMRLGGHIELMLVK